LYNNLKVNTENTKKKRILKIIGGKFSVGGSI
jgi:hypothetical protein